MVSDGGIKFPITYRRGMRGGVDGASALPHLCRHHCWTQPPIEGVAKYSREIRHVILTL
jgi:hypothetical protein